MKDLIQSIKNFLLDIQPKLEAAKQEIPETPTIESEIEKIGTLEVLESVVEEVETLADYEKVLSDNELTPEEVGLSKVEETTVDTTELNKLKELVIEKDSTISELTTQLSNLKIKFDSLDKEYKEQFNLSNINKKNSDNMSEKEYLKLILKNKNK